MVRPRRRRRQSGPAFAALLGVCAAACVGDPPVRAGPLDGDAGSRSEDARTDEPGVTMVADCDGTDAGSPGIWTDVTPTDLADALLSAAPDGASPGTSGVLHVLVDPRSPNVMYALVNAAGVWKSEDCGRTWFKANTTVNVEDTALKGAAIAPNGDLFAAIGSILFKSTDAAVTWEALASNIGNKNGNLGNIAVDPYDARHLLATSWDYPGVSESTSGGTTWTSYSGGATSPNPYAFFLDTGGAASTAQLWIEVEAIWQTSVGIYRSENGGVGPWTLASDVDPGAPDSFTHLPEYGQTVAAGGAQYVALYGGVFKSVDQGQSWSPLDPLRRPTTALTATATRLYAANGDGKGIPAITPRTAFFVSETSWGDMPIAIGDSTYGPARLASTTDGKRWFVVGAMQATGIWRYIEP